MLPKDTPSLNAYSTTTKTVLLQTAKLPEEDKTPKVNGTPILEYTSKGIKKIDVYGYENPTTVNVTGITLSQTEAAMTVGGETLTLTATVAPDDATDKTVTWTTSNADIATVENGVVTAVAAGTATITVTTTDGSFTATCDVTVTAPAPSGVEDVQSDKVQTTKFFRDGQLLVEKNGKIYNATGAEVK